MAQNSKPISMSQVVGRLMLDLQTTEEIGYVAELLVDESRHQVVGLTSRTGLIGQRRRFGWQQVTSIGRDGVLLTAPAGEDGLDEALPLAMLEVWSEAGERVGQLADFEFDRQTGAIERYLFVPEPALNLEPGLYGIAPAMVISAGRKRMMVRLEALRSPDLVEAGESESFRLPSPGSPDPASAWRVPGIPEDFQARSQQLAHQAQERLREQFQGQWPKNGPKGPPQIDPQALQDQWQEKSQHFADQAKGQFDQVMNRFRKRSRRLRHQLRETVTDWSEELPNPQRFRHQPRRDQARRTIDVDPTEVWPEDDVSDGSNQP